MSLFIIKADDTDILSLVKTLVYHLDSDHDISILLSSSNNTSLYTELYLFCCNICTPNQVIEYKNKGIEIFSAKEKILNYLTKNEKSNSPI